jgi:hypothetical protein
MVRRCARTFVVWMFLASLTGLVGSTPASASVEVQKQWIGAPEFSGPEGIATDVSDDVFVVDQGNDRILKFDPAGRARHGVGILRHWQRPVQRSDRHRCRYVWQRVCH